MAPTLERFNPISELRPPFRGARSAETGPPRDRHRNIGMETEFDKFDF